MRLSDDDRPALIPLLRPHIGASTDASSSTIQSWDEPMTPDARNRRDWLIVLGLTLLGGLLRFLYLDQPVIWGDEAITFGRVAGPYSELLIGLRDAGFAPLHYELYWVIGRVHQLTPFVMRLVPAIAGTFIVPAVYLLARQLVARRAALLATFFTAISAYLLVYSRDAKMYSHFWLFATLHMATMVWWFRTRRTIPWLCWVASGCAMIGLDSIGAILIAIEIPMLLSQKRVHWSQSIFFVLGIAIILTGPVGYYIKFNEYTQRISEGGWGATGIHWIEPYNAGRDGGDLLLFTATAFLTGWEWPQEKLQTIVAPAALESLKTVCVLVFALLAIGAFPWPSRRRARNTQLDAITSPQAWWRTAMWLALWTIVPLYGFYCASVKGFLSPFQILWTLVFQNPPTIPWPDASQPRHFAQTLATLWTNLGTDVRLANLHWPFVILAPAMLVGCFIACGDDWRQRWSKTGFVAMIAAIIIALCGVLYACASIQAPGSVWMPRYLGILWPALAIAVAVLVLRLPNRWLRRSAIALIVIANLAQFSARVFLHPEPPVDLVARDVWDTRDNNGPVLAYVRLGGGPAPGEGWIDGDMGKYFLSLLHGEPFTFTDFRSGIVGRLVEVRSINSNRRFGPRDSNSPDFRSMPANVREVIVWDHTRRGQPFADDDRPRSQLGEGWKMSEESLWQNYDHWTWRRLEQVRRRTYVRAAPTTAPTTRVAEK